MDARVRLASLANRREELSILQLDTVHRDIDLRYVDLLVLAVDEIVVARNVRTVIADVPEERPKRAIVVK